MSRILIISCVVFICIRSGDAVSDEGANEVDKMGIVLADIGAEQSILRGLNLASAICGRAEFAADPRWRSVVLKCNELVSSESVLQEVSVNVLAKVAHRYPDLAVESLNSLLEGIARASGGLKCRMIATIGMLSIESEAGCDRLRRELVEDRPFGEYYSIHAATTIAKICPELNERAAMVTLLTSRLKDTREHVRWMSADGLGLIGEGSHPAIDDLRSLMEDECPSVRAAAARAILRIAKEDPNAVDVLIGVLLCEDTLYFTRPRFISENGSSSRVLAMQAFGEYGSSKPSIVDSIAIELESSQPMNRRIAIATLQKLLNSADVVPSLTLKHLEKAARLGGDIPMRRDAEELLKKIATNSFR